jgi:hypothetical protein
MIMPKSPSIMPLDDYPSPLGSPTDSPDEANIRALEGRFPDALYADLVTCKKVDCSDEKNVGFVFRKDRWVSDGSPEFVTRLMPLYHPSGVSQPPAQIFPFAVQRSGAIAAITTDGDVVFLRGARRAPSMPAAIQGCTPPLRFALHIQAADANDDNAWAIAETCNVPVLVQWNEPMTQAAAFALPVPIRQPRVTAASGEVYVWGRDREGAFHALRFTGSSFEKLEVPVKSGNAAVLMADPIRKRQGAVVIEGTPGRRSQGQPEVVDEIRIVHRLRSGEIERVEVPASKWMALDADGGIWLQRAGKSPTEMCWLGPRTKTAVMVKAPTGERGETIELTLAHPLSGGAVVFLGKAFQPDNPKKRKAITLVHSVKSP